MTTSTASSNDTKAKAEELLPSLKEALGDSANHVSDANLIKFLHWKPDVQRAVGRFRDHVKWRKENPWVFDEPTPLLISKDDDIKRVLESEFLIAPDGLVAKDGSTLMIGRLRNNDMTDGRTVEDVVRSVLYTMDRAMERESTQHHGVTIFHDMKGVTRDNIHTSIPKTLFPAIIGHFPLRITAIYILNAPFFVKGLFKVLSVLLPSKVRKRMHFVSDLDKIFQYVDQDKLLEEHGGQLEFDQKVWVAKQIEREESGSIESLVEIVQLA